MRAHISLSVLLMGVVAAGVHAQTVAPGENVSHFVPVETDASGHGVSRDAAVGNALANALAQELGVDVAKVNVSSSVDAQADGNVAVTKTGGSTEAARRWTGTATTPNTETTTLAAKFSGQADTGVTASVSGGHIVRYQVVSLLAAQGGGFDARVHAVLQLDRREGGEGEHRRRVAIAAFTGAAGDAAATTLHDRLVIALTQTRRFAVVDRADDADYAHEMAVIQAQGGAGERGRASQVLGADYILTGKLHVAGGKTTGHAAQTTTQRLELTGEIVSTTVPGTLHHSAGSSDADFELIEIATRQIILADHVSLSGTGMDGVAETIAADIIGAIYPPRLVSITDPAALIINQGGAGMHRGQRFRLMQTGAELFDPYTHESLGSAERQMGVIEVADVQARLSYARLVEGALPATPETALLRPLAAPAAPKAVAAAGRRRAGVRQAVVRETPAEPAQGVRLPFDH